MANAIKHSGVCIVPDPTPASVLAETSCSKAAGDKELVALSAKAQSVGARAWCISRSGFTPAARAYAAAHGVLLSTRSDLDQIARILG